MILAVDAARVAPGGRGGRRRGRGQQLAVGAAPPAAHAAPGAPQPRRPRGRPRGRRRRGRSPAAEFGRRRARFAAAAGDAADVDGRAGAEHVAAPVEPPL